jgi:hypothetical protein
MTRSEFQYRGAPERSECRITADCPGSKLEADLDVDELRARLGRI